MLSSGPNKNQQHAAVCPLHKQENETRSTEMSFAVQVNSTSEPRRSRAVPKTSMDLHELPNVIAARVAGDSIPYEKSAGGLHGTSPVNATETLATSVISQENATNSIPHPASSSEFGLRTMLSSADVTLPVGMSQMPVTGSPPAEVLAILNLELNPAGNETPVRSRIQELSLRLNLKY